MTLEDKIYFRCQAVYKTRGVKPIGVVLDRDSYITMRKMSVWESRFVQARFSLEGGDRYNGLLVSVAETDEETIIVY